MTTTKARRYRIVKITKPITGPYETGERVSYYSKSSNSREMAVIVKKIVNADGAAIYRVIRDSDRKYRMLYEQKHQMRREQ